jgi:hypothetical protein
MRIILFLDRGELREMNNAGRMTNYGVIMKIIFNVSLGNVDSY